MNYRNVDYPIVPIIGFTLFFAAGFTFLLLALRAWHWGVGFEKRALTTTGQVTEVVQKWIGQRRLTNYRWSGSDYSYSPKIAFITVDGRHIEFDGPSTYGKPDYSRGDTLQIDYDLDNPEKAFIHQVHSSFSWLTALWGMVLMLISSGGLWWIITETLSLAN
jgi:hypothetical protein